MIAKQIQKIACDLLALREHSQFELKQKLMKKGFSADLIIPVIKNLTEKGWQSDKRFATLYLSARSNKGYGAIRIRLELKEKGVTDEIINECFLETDIVWEELAFDVKRRRFGLAKATDIKERARQMRFLQQRGFDFDIIKKVVSHEELQ